MTVEIDRNGMIKIEAETPLEAFALQQTMKGVESKDVYKKVLISTGLDKG